MKNTASSSKPAITTTKKRIVASFVSLCVLLVVYLLLSFLILSKTINFYYVNIINLVCINIVAAASLNMVTGMLGQLVLGHASFMLIGAYSSAMLSKALGWPLAYSLPLGLLLGGSIAAVASLVIGLPALRLRGDYLAIITLGFGEIIRIVANNLSFTNGARGFSGFPTFSGAKHPTAMFSFVFAAAAFTVFFSYTFGTSRHGRAARAIREDEIAAESSGVNTTYYKLMAFALSAFFAGVAGGLLAHHDTLVDPSTYSFTKSVDYLMMVVLGGMGSITGSVASAGVLTFLPELLRPVAQWRMLIYSVVLVLVMLFRPSGLMGRKEMQVIPFYSKIFPWFRRKTSKQIKAEQKMQQGGKV